VDHHIREIITAFDQVHVHLSLSTNIRIYW